MKRSNLITILLLFALFYCSTIACSQIILKGEDGSVISETMIDIYLDTDVYFYTYEATTINNSDSTLTLNAKRIELSYIPNTHEIFDWNCGLPPLEAGTEEVFYSPSLFEIEFDAGDSSFSGLPSFLFWPNENVGDAIYRYVVYDVNNPNDSTWVDVHYYVGILNVEEKISANQLKVYPSPAQNNIFVNLDLKGESMDFEIISMLGTRIQIEHTQSINGEITIDVSALAPGIYLLQEKSSQLTREFIISR